MNRSDYAYARYALAQYEEILSAAEIFKDRNGNTIISPLHGEANFISADRESAAGNFDLWAILAALLFEDHDGTDPGGGVQLAADYNFGGIKWAGQPGAYDSGIQVPPAEQPGTYAGFTDFGGFVRELIRTMNNEFIGPAFQSGNLAGAWAIYVGGPRAPNVQAGQARVDQWRYYRGKYPPQGETNMTVVYASAVIASSMRHLGDTHEFDTWNGDHAVSMFCEADIEDWLTEAGVQNVPHYGSAAEDGDAGPLNSGHAPAAAKVFFRGPGWSPFDHVGLSLGDGRTISGLTSVVITTGWQDLDTYRGWRYPDGVQADPTTDFFLIEGNPLGPIPIMSPFWNRWNALNQIGLALPMMGYAMEPERTLDSGRRVQRFQRGWFGIQPAPDPWDVVALLPSEYPG